MDELLEQYMDRKICYKCSTPQSVNRTYCFKKSCYADLRLRKAYKRR